MPFPNKFRKLIETTSNEVEQPDFVWLVYAVCACEEDSCGWAGWIIDGVFVRKDTSDSLLSSHLCEACPKCGKPLFRTDVTIKYVPSEDQTPRLALGIDYEQGEIEYGNDE